MPSISGSSPARNPFVWSVAAVVVAVIALAVAVTALSRVSKAPVAMSRDTTPATVVTDAATATSSHETTDQTTEPGSADSEGPVSTDLPSAGASYSLALQDRSIRLPGGGNRTLDLDQPLVNAGSNQYDVTYLPGYEPSLLSFGTERVAIAQNPDVTPDECAQNIQLAPADSRVPVSQDLVVCYVTNGIGAANEPANARMARIVINSVAKDDSLSLTLTTWEIPH